MNNGGLKIEVVEMFEKLRINFDGMGMSEYLDQIVDGRPVGSDFR